MEMECGGRKLHRDSQEMRKSRKFKAMQASNWYKSRRGGKDKRDAKDTPDPVKEITPRWRGKTTPGYQETEEVGKHH